MYSPLLFTTSSFAPLDQFFDAIPLKIPGLVSKNLLRQFLKSSSLLKVTPSYGLTKSEKIVIHGCKVRRIRQMPKDLPFELLECGFDDLCNMRPGVVVKKYGLALLMGSFQSNSLIHAI